MTGAQDGPSEDSSEVSSKSETSKPDLRFGSLQDFDVQVDRNLIGDGHHLIRGDGVKYLGINFRSVGVPKEREKLAPLETSQVDEEHQGVKADGGPVPPERQVPDPRADLGQQPTLLARLVGVWSRLTRI